MVATGERQILPPVVGEDPGVGRWLPALSYTLPNRDFWEARTEPAWLNELISLVSALGLEPRTY